MYPTKPEGLVDPCPRCGVSQYRYVVHPSGCLVESSPRIEPRTN
jgi:hypothetical protein